MEMSPAIITMLNFGIVGTAFLAVAEKFVPVFPSYLLLMFLGMTATDGFNLVSIVAATVVGSTLGSLIWYRLGRTLGFRRVEALVSRYGRFVFLPPALYQRLIDAYRRNQFWVTLIGHTIPAVRVYIGLPAGVFRLEPWYFTLAALLGCLLWNAPFLILGFALHGGGHDPIALGLAVAVTLISTEFAVLWIARRMRRGQDAGG